MSDRKTITFEADKETLNIIADYKDYTRIGSRSEVIRQLIRRGKLDKESINDIRNSHAVE